MAIEAAKLNVIIGADTSGAQRGIGMVDRALSGMGRTAEMAIGYMAGTLLMNAGRAVTQLGQQALASYSEYEMLGMSLDSLVARELRNADATLTQADALALAGEKSAELLGWIEDLAIKSPFKQSGVAEAFRTAMAYGFTADEAQRLTDATINFASGSGASSQSMNRIALALGQIKAKGKLAGQEMLQLTEAGLDVRKILADSIGVTTEELVEMQEKGLIPADLAIEAIVKSLEEDFAGAAERGATSFTGLISSIDELKETNLRTFFEGAFKEVQPYVQGLVDFLSSEETKEKISEFGEKFGNSIGNAIAWIDGLVAKVEPFAMDIKTALETGDWDAVIDTVWGWIKTAGGLAEEKINEYVSKIPEVVGKIDLEGTFSAFDAWAEPVWNWITLAGGLALEKITAFLENMYLSITDPAVVEKAGEIGQTIGNYIGEKIFSDETLAITEEQLGNFIFNLAGSVAKMSVEIDGVARAFTKGFISGLVKHLTEDMPEGVKDALIEGLTGAVRLANPLTMIYEIYNMIKTAVTTAWEMFKKSNPINIGELFGVTTYGTTSGTGIVSDGEALGGAVYPGKPYLVGERGIEVFVPTSAGRIIPNNKASGWVVIEAGAIQINGVSKNTDIPFLVDTLMDEIQRRLI